MGEGPSDETAEDVDKEDNVGDLYKTVLAAGFPTFEQFKKNPEILRPIKDRLLQSVDGGQHLLTNVRSHKYFFMTRNGNKYECASLEKVQDIADQEGVLIADLSVNPQLREDVSGKLIIECTFKDKRVSCETTET